jgi:predicted MFS family arabinose efflux permease
MSNRGYRWIVLGVYLPVAGLSQLLWLNFAPLLNWIQKRYAVSENISSLLLLVFPLLYVLLSLPAGALIDRKGYRYGIGLGAVIMACGATLRIADSSFAWLLAGQVVIAAAQPLVINGISKLVGDWFTREQSAIATGIGTMGMFIGMTIGMAATPALNEWLGFRATMGAFAAISWLACIAFLVFARTSGRGLDSEASVRPLSELGWLVKNRSLLLLFALAFLGLGFFNGLTTWLEAILAPNHIDSLQAGLIGGALILGGVVGAVVVPALSDHFKRRKPFLVGSVAAALAALYPLCGGQDYHTLLALGALLGFCFLPAYALLLEMCSELAGEAWAGSATGILMLAGNAGGVVVTLAMVWIKGDAPTFRAAVHLLFAILLVTVALATRMGETYGARERGGSAI